MEFWAKVIALAITRIMSILDASSLRDRVYELKNEHEIMWTALDDINRMYPDTPAGKYARKTLDKIPNRYTLD